MKIEKGAKIIVHDKRYGKFFAIANSNIDTDTDGIYDIVLDQDNLNHFKKGDQVPIRHGMSFITIRH